MSWKLNLRENRGFEGLLRVRLDQTRLREYEIFDDQSRNRGEATKGGTDVLGPRINREDP